MDRARYVFQLRHSHLHLYIKGSDREASGSHEETWTKRGD